MFPEIYPEAMYASDHPALDVLGKPQTRARKRHEGKGCRFIKVGSRVVYRGSDVLGYLERSTIETSE